MRLDIVLSVAIVVVALAAAWWFRPAPVADPTSSTVMPVVATMAPRIVVHVSGSVEQPGLVQLNAGARVADAVAAAGGASPDADLSRMNLAAPVADGQQVVVAAHGAAATPVTAADGMVRINLASASDLENLPGVGPVLAERIVAHRDLIGGFQIVEDLLDVPGIGEAKLASLRDLISVP